MFLGFLFVCGKSLWGQFLVHRKSRRDRMQAKLKEVKKELRKRWLASGSVSSINDDAACFRSSLRADCDQLSGVPVGLGVGAAFALAALRVRQGKLAPAPQR